MNDNLNPKGMMCLFHKKDIPRELPNGMVLVHNNVRPRRTLGAAGFRAWTQKLDDHLVVYDCDWAGIDLHGLIHYRPIHWKERKPA